MGMESRRGVASWSGPVEHNQALGEPLGTLDLFAHQLPVRTHQPLRRR